MKQPPDQAHRDQALAIDRSFIVQAPAGAGKTGLLVRRLLKLLAIVQQPEEILAITFTRKATEEMRARVMDALHKARNKEAFKEFEADLERYAEAVLAHDAKHSWQLLDHPRRLRILTIDSLTSELVRQMPWSSRFGAMPQIGENLDSVYEQAALDTLQSIDQAPKPLADAIHTLMVELGGNLQQLVLQLADMLKNRQQWLPLLIHQQTRIADRHEIEAAWQAEIETRLRTVDTLIKLPTRVALTRLGAYAADQLIAANKTAPVTRLAEQRSWPPALASALPTWQALAELLLTAQGGWRKATGVNIRLGFPPKQAETAEFKDLITQLAEADDRGEQAAALHALRSLPPAEFSDRHWGIFEALLQLLPAAASQLYLHFGSNNRCDFTEITRRAIDALGKDDAPSELALVQDYRTQHILMDEFQDTSPEQLELLERLIAGWQTDDGRTLFLVGDPMQSIYRFRDADVRVFLRVCEHGIGLSANGTHPDVAQLRPEFLQLSANFRSAPDILHWVNSVFPNVLPRENRFALGAIRYETAQPQLDHTGDICFHPIIDAEPGGAAQAVVDHIRTAQAQLPPAKENEAEPTIAVLAASRSQLSLIAGALVAAGIEFESIELEGLAEQPVSEDLFSLSRAILHPFDRIAWLALLRAPWCGLTLVELNRIAAAAHPDTSAIESVIESAARDPELSADTRARLQRFQQAMTPILAQRGRSALAHMTRQAWFALAGPACHSASQNAHAERFLTMLDELEATGELLTPDTIARTLAAQRVSTTERPIKLLTMHKAKGLEFDTVMLVGLDRIAKGRSRFRALLNWDHREVLDQETGPTRSRLLVAPITPLSDKDNPRRQYLANIDAQRGRYEAGRLLYVAATRARRVLHLFAEFQSDQDGTLSTPREQSLLSLIWADTHADWTAAAQQPHPEPTALPAEISGSLSLLHRLPAAFVPPPLADAIIRPAGPPPAMPEADTDRPADDEHFVLAQQIGIVIHQFLENADLAQLDDWHQNGISPARIESALIQQGISAEALADAQKAVADCLQMLASDDTARWIFNPEHTEAHAEWRLQSTLCEPPQLFIVDRSFVDAAGIRWIIDFKTGSPGAGQSLDAFLKNARHAHFAQLQQYMTLLRELEPERTLRCGLYFPAVPAWLEIQGSDSSTLVARTNSA